VIRALIADDEALSRRLVHQLLERHADVVIVAECTDGEEAREAIATHDPDVLFLDIRGFTAMTRKRAARISRARYPAGASPSTSDASSERSVSVRRASRIARLGSPQSAGRRQPFLRRARLWIRYARRRSERSWAFCRASSAASSRCSFR